MNRRFGYPPVAGVVGVVVVAATGTLGFAEKTSAVCLLTPSAV